MYSNLDELEIRVARSYLTRLRGLLFAPPLPPNTGLLIAPCPSVHTCFMSYTIDVVFLDRAGTITKICPNLAPWGMARCGKAYQTLELLAGGAEQLGLKVGDSLAKQIS